METWTRWSSPGLPLLPVALVLWMRRRHPGMPRGWWVSQSDAAILHRRLHRGVDETRRAVARAGAGVSIDQLKSLTEDLDQQAIAIDAKLVEASRLPGKPRHKALVELKYRVVETEKLAVRVREARRRHGKTAGRGRRRRQPPDP